MDPIRVQAQSWLVVCDGAKAMVLQNDGNADRPNLTVIETLDQPNEPDREIGSDRAGRAHQANGVSGSAVDQTDWHKQAEAEFLKEVAGRIAALADDGNDNDIVLVAPPRALGLLRPQFSSSVKAAIKTEIPKDFVHMPVSDIEQHLVRMAG